MMLIHVASRLCYHLTLMQYIKHSKQIPAKKKSDLYISHSISIKTHVNARSQRAWWSVREENFFTWNISATNTQKVTNEVLNGSPKTHRASPYGVSFFLLCWLKAVYDHLPQVNGLTVWLLVAFHGASAINTGWLSCGKKLWRQQG